MNAPRHGRFERRSIDELTVRDESSFRHISLYGDLKQVLRCAKYPFRILPKTPRLRADRALLLNLTFWAADAGGDVLVDEHIDADVVAHAAWHHLAARAFAHGPSGRPSAAALFLGESIASAFDVYLVGRALGHAARSTFLETQVPAMADAADASGLSEEDFEKLLEELAADPERAFADLRERLFDAASALFACQDDQEAYAALLALDEQRLASLLPHYELSNWVLYARAYAHGQDDPRVGALDAELRGRGRGALDWLEEEWVAPAIGAG